MLLNSLLKVCSYHNYTLAVVFQGSSTRIIAQSIASEINSISGMTTGFETAKQTTHWSTAHTVQGCECHIKHTFNQLWWRGSGRNICSASLFGSWSTRGLHAELNLQYKTEATTLRAYKRWGALLHYPLKNPFTSKGILNEGRICKQDHAWGQARCTERERGTGKEEKSFTTHWWDHQGSSGTALKRNL